MDSDAPPGVNGLLGGAATGLPGTLLPAGFLARQAAAPFGGPAA